MRTEPVVSPASFPVVLLAAGKSSRLGMPKGLFPVQGRPWITLQLAALKRAGLREIIVVLGHDREKYLAIPELARVRSVVNSAPERGQFSSVQLGLEAALEREAPGVFVLPVDTPCAGPEVWDELAGALSPAAAACLPEVGGDGGHPCLLSDAFARDLVGLATDQPDSRLDAQMAELPRDRVRRIACADQRAILNLNTPEDFARWAP